MSEFNNIPNLFFNNSSLWWRLKWGQFLCVFRGAKFSDTAKLVP